MTISRKKAAHTNQSKSSIRGVKREKDYGRDSCETWHTCNANQQCEKSCIRDYP